MLIIETEPTIGISTMAELKDSMREKLVNDIIEDLNLHSSNKENVETPDNLIRNGTIEGKDKEVDIEEPILNIKQENNQLEGGIDIENVHDLNNIEKDTNTDGCTHEEKEVESQHEIDLNSRSLTNNNDDTHIEPIKELKHILKKEIDDSIIQEQNEEENVNVPVVDALEQNDNVVHIEEIKKSESVTTVELSESNDSHDNRDVSNTNVSKKSDESEMDVIEVNKQQENSMSLNETELVSTSNNLAVNEAELSNTPEPNRTEPELKTQDTDESNEVKCMDTVIIDDKDNDGLAEKNECMQIDDVEENLKETNVNTIIDCEDNSEAIENPIPEEPPSGTIVVGKDDVVVVEEDEKEKNAENNTSTEMSESNKINKSLIRRNSSICRLSNNLDILSDDDDDETAKEAAPETDTPIESNKVETVVADKQCINIEDDDDIMLIEEDIPSKEVENKNETIKETLPEPVKPVDNTNYEATNVDEETGENKSSFMESIELVSNKNDKESISPVTVPPEGIQPNEKAVELDVKLSEIEKPLLPENVLSLSKKKLSDMTREDLEEFCILKIVESIMDRSQLSDIKAKLSSMTQNFNEYRKKANALAKQNRDLQVVLKSVQEEQKKLNETYNVITPLKITRSVGMQIQMPDKITLKRKNSNAQNTRSVKTPNQNLTRAQKLGPNQIIPVPKLVPASNTTLKSPTVNVPNTPNNVVRVPNTLSNIVKISPVQKVAEKRPFSKTQAITVDLTDDEPPAKMVQRASPAPPVRVIPSQNLMATPRQHTPLGQMVNNQRKVFIPIGSQTGQNLRPGHNIMLKTVSPNGPRLRGPGPNIIRSPNQGRVRTGPVNRHPAPLPDATKQYQPPNWKALPPAPDLKLSKVDNGIVISWKIDGYQEDLFEQIASYQLYAYQETNSPPSTSLWKKIGDVAALPLPMACTLTQFTAGFKYFFAVRAVDVRSRIGPFSLPGSILLLKTM